MNEYETLLQGTQDAIILVDVVDSNTFKVIRNNQAHAKATGLTSELLEGKTLQEEELYRQLNEEMNNGQSRCTNGPCQQLCLLWN